MRAKLREVKDQLKRRRHQPIPEQGRWLASVVRGHLAYYAVPGNTDAVAAFRTQVTRHWYKALRRRSQRTRLNWERMNRIATRWLPPARVMHPFPERALRRQNPRQEPSAVVPHAGICAGGRPQGRSLPRLHRITDAGLAHSLLFTHAHDHLPRTGLAELRNRPTWTSALRTGSRGYDAPSTTSPPEHTSPHEGSQPPLPEYDPRATVDSIMTALPLKPFYRC